MPGQTGPEIVVVAASLRCGPSDLEDLAVAALAADLAALAPDTPVRVAVLDGHLGGPAAEQLRAAGVAVDLGPADWAGWASARWLQCSVVVVAAATLGSEAAGRIRASQPQAAQVLFAPGGGFAFRRIEALDAATHPDERAGLAQLLRSAEDVVADAAATFDAAWCEHGADAAWLSGRHPKLEVTTLVTARPAVEPPRPLGDRHGVVVLCDRGYDVGTDDEAAALHALRVRVPALRRVDPGVGVAVVADEASPELRLACEAAGAELVPLRAAPAAVAHARVAIDERPGPAAEATVRLAVACGTPAVLAGGGAPGHPADEGASADAAGVVAAQLLGDDRAWQGAVGELRRFEEEGGGEWRRRRGLVGALADLGVDAPGALAPRIAVNPLPPVPRQVSPPLRPAGWVGPPPAPPSKLTDRDERYRAWAATRGATPATVSAVGAALASLRRRSTFTVAVPFAVGTDPIDLDESLRSVRSQVDDRWELLVVATPTGEGPARRALELAAAGDAVDVAVADVDDLDDGTGAPDLEAVIAAALDATRGDYLAVLPPGDTLEPHALGQLSRWIDAQPAPPDVVYADEDGHDRIGRLVELAAKPDWSPSTLLSQAWIGRALFVRRAVLAEVGVLSRLDPPPADPGGFGVEGPDPSVVAAAVHDLSCWDLALRIAERTDRFVRVPEPLLTRHASASPSLEGGVGEPVAALRRRVAAAALRRRSGSGTVDDGLVAGSVRPRFPIRGRPRVAIIVPTHNSPELLRTCLTSVMGRSTWPATEVVVVDNRTDDTDALRLLAGMPGRVIRYPHPFNYARMMNLAAGAVRADVLVFLNNDTEVIAPDWIEAMLEHVLRPEVGAVGARLRLSDGRSQHEGILLGTGGWAHNLRHEGLWGRGDIVRDTSAITGACLMMRREVWDRVGGNDERLRIAYNDIDVCLRVRQAGYQVVYTPYAELFHHESATRGSFEHPDEAGIFERRWRVKDHVDPYYGPSYVPHSPFFQLDV